LIALFTGTLWWATIGLQEASTEQSTAMQESIAQLARAAKAMEDVAKHFADNVATFRERSSQQMRAYIAVVVNAGTYQERDKDLRFAGIPMMANTGDTPARKVEYRAAADILPVPLPDEFAFPLPDRREGGATLNAHNNFTMQIVVKDYQDDADVVSIMRARDGRALYVGGWSLTRIFSVKDARRNFPKSLLGFGEGIRKRFMAISLLSTMSPHKISTNHDAHGELLHGGSSLSDDESESGLSRRSPSWRTDDVLSTVG
jgi:hypothetical protein